MNAIHIIGRLTANPELKVTPTGISVCSFTLAVKRPHVKDTTDFLTVIVWRQSAEYISRYGRKGSIVSVSGILTTRKYVVDDQNRIAYEIVADSVSVLSGNDSAKTQQDPTQAPNQANFGASEATDDTPVYEAISSNGDLPF